MSKGLGEIQKKILEMFNDYGVVSISEIVVYVYNPLETSTESQHKSVCRAVRNLEKRGLVKTKILTRKNLPRKDKNEDNFQRQFVKVVCLPDLYRKETFDDIYDLYFEF